MTIDDAATRAFEIDQLEASREGSRAQAGAKAANAIASLLNQVLDESLFSQAEIADRMGVTEGRVSQLVNGDGNLKTTTVARFLEASGFDLCFHAIPADRDSGMKSISAPRKRRRQRRGSIEMASVRLPGAKAASSPVDYVWASHIEAVPGDSRAQASPVDA